MSCMLLEEETNLMYLYWQAASVGATEYLYVYNLTSQQIVLSMCKYYKYISIYKIVNFILLRPNM